MKQAIVMRHAIVTLAAGVVLGLTVHAQATPNLTKAGCLVFINTRIHPVTLELPREVSGHWDFAAKDGDEKPYEISKNGYLVRVDKDTILRLTYQGQVTEITLEKAEGHGAVWTPSLSTGGQSYWVQHTYTTPDSTITTGDLVSVPYVDNSIKCSDKNGFAWLVKW